MNSLITAAMESISQNEEEENPMDVDDIQNVVQKLNFNTEVRQAYLVIKHTNFWY